MRHWLLAAVITLGATTAMAINTGTPAPTPTPTPEEFCADPGMWPTLCEEARNQTNVPPNVRGKVLCCHGTKIVCVSRVSIDGELRRRA
jgi:hypothetical protein